MSAPLDLRQRLHDGLCQQLTGALMIADVLHRKLVAQGHRETEEASHLLTILKEAADEVQAIVQDLGKTSRNDNP